MLLLLVDGRVVPVVHSVVCEDRVRNRSVHFDPALWTCVREYLPFVAITFYYEAGCT